MQITKFSRITIVLHIINLVFIIFIFKNKSLLPYVVSFYVLIFVFLIGEFFKKNKIKQIKIPLLYSFISLIFSLIYIKLLFEELI